MKIERLSENKIKCTLTREDLDSHNIVLTEFAYGSEKARAFFRDLMLQAEDEVGFEVEDIPLMIEAIPVNQDCIVLIVTKVLPENAEELDTRFSRFSSSPDGDSYEDEDEVDFQDEEVIDIADLIDSDSEMAQLGSELFGAVKDAMKSAMEGLTKAASGNADAKEDAFVPLNQSAKKVGDSKNAKKESAKDTSKKVKPHSVVYNFSSFEDVCNAAKGVAVGQCGDNTLYKDMVSGMYYLVLSNGGQTPERFTTVCNMLSEYGKRDRNSYALQAYLEEHYICVIRSNAMQTLANL